MGAPLPKPDAAAIQEKLDSAFRLLGEKKYAESERLCRETLQSAPDHAHAHFLLGATYCFSGQFEKALPPLRQAIALDPRHVLAHYNIGVACGSLKRQDEAMESYRRALAVDPDHSYSLNNLGTVLVDTGRPDDAISHFRHLVEKHPSHALAAINLVRAETMLQPMSAWSQYCNATLTGKAPLSNENRYLALIHRASAEWMINDLPALSTTLWAAGNVRPPAPTPRTENQMKYEGFLHRLVAYRNANPTLYAGSGEPLFLVGDSHSLSYANTRLMWNGAERKISGHLIVGAKAWHISSPQPNQYMAALDAHIDRLPQGAELICAFGEIDCRLDSGILPYCKKSAQPLEKVVPQQVASYVAAMQARTAKKTLKLSFLSPPAPHPRSGDRRTVMKLFATALEKEVRKNGGRYIDVYNLVVGKDGYAQDSYCIDEFHLNPGALQAAASK